MSDTKFTKGPWFIGKYNNITSESVDCFSSIHVNSTMTLAHDKNNEEYTANAHLIAAAPEMYEMLKSLKSELEAIDSEYNNPELNRLLLEARGG